MKYLKLKNVFKTSIVRSLDTHVVLDSSKSLTTEMCDHEEFRN